MGPDWSSLDWAEMAKGSRKAPQKAVKRQRRSDINTCECLAGEITVKGRLNDGFTKKSNFYPTLNGSLALLKLK